MDEEMKGKEETKPVRRLAEFQDPDTREVTKNTENVLNRELTIVGIEEREGTNGLWLIVHAVDVRGEDMSFSTGGFLLVPALLRVKEADEFPVKATIYKQGRTYRFR